MQQYMTYRVLVTGAYLSFTWTR